MSKQETDDVEDVVHEDVEVDDGDQTPKSQLKGRTASERLRDIDRKTFMFAVYIFLAMLFCAAAATTGVLVTMNKRKPPVESNVKEPSSVPSLTPTPAPSRTPSLAPTLMYSLSPAVPDWNDVADTLYSVFGAGNCSEMIGVVRFREATTGGIEEATGGIECSIRTSDFKADAKYCWKGQSSNKVPSYLEVSGGWRDLNSTEFFILELSTDFSINECDLGCFQSYFDTIIECGANGR